MSSVRARIGGLSQLKANSAAAKAALRRGLAGAIYREGEAIMARSKKEFVPVRTGDLKSSGQVTLPEWRGNQVTVEMGYGNQTVNYALIVHEKLNANHPVGQAKYLETPTLEAIPGMAGRIRNRVRQELAGVGL